MNNIKEYTTDNRVIHKSQGVDIVQKIGNVLGKKFWDYREKWDKVNKLELVTDFPLFLHLDL